MSALYDVWVLRDGAVHHRGTTDTTVGVLGPTDIGAVARGAVVLLYRGGSKAQQAQLLKAAKERAVRGAPPSGPVPCAPPGIAQPSNGPDESSAHDELAEGDGDGELDHVDGEPVGPSGVRASLQHAPRRGARAPRRMTEEYVPLGIFAPAAMPCRDCGETEGHTPRCPRNPDAEILPEPIYAPRPAVVVFERSIERAADVAAAWSAAPPAANDTEAPAIPVVAELDFGPLAASSVPATPVSAEPEAEKAAQPSEASSVASEAPAQPRPKARAARPKVPRQRPADRPKPLARRTVPPSAQEALVEDFTRRLLALFDRSAWALLRRRPW